MKDNQSAVAAGSILANATVIVATGMSIITIMIITAMKSVNITKSIGGNIGFIGASRHVKNGLPKWRHIFESYRLKSRQSKKALPT